MLELSKSDLKAPAPSGGGELAANAVRQQRGGAAGSVREIELTSGVRGDIRKFMSQISSFIAH